MEIDDLKSDWNTIKPTPKSEETLLLMLQENKHPVLKSIRKQIVFEVLAWFFFLMVYYSMFDGAEKPLWVNLVFTGTLLLPITHSIYGYYYNKYLVNGSNIKMALDQLYNRLKNYALFSVVGRIGFICGLLLFFTYNIDFTATKYYSLAVIVIVFLIQMFVLYRIWNKRLKRIRDTIYAFSADV